jgi:hypothetical protein
MDSSQSDRQNQSLHVREGDRPTQDVGPGEMHATRRTGSCLVPGLSKEKSLVVGVVLGSG